MEVNLCIFVSDNGNKYIDTDHNYSFTLTLEERDRITNIVHKEYGWCYHFSDGENKNINLEKEEEVDTAPDEATAIILM